MLYETTGLASLSFQRHCGSGVCLGFRVLLCLQRRHETRLPTRHSRAESTRVALHSRLYISPPRWLNALINDERTFFHRCCVREKERAREREAGKGE